MPILKLDSSAAAPPARPQASWATRGLLFALLLGLAACKKQETPEPPPKAPPAPAAPAAAQPAVKTSFSDVTSQLDAGGNLYAYLSTEQWASGLSTNLLRLREFVKALPDTSESDQDMIGAAIQAASHLARESGVEQISGVGVSSAEVAPGFYRSKMILHHYQGRNEGLLWNAMGRAPHALKIVDLLPANTSVLAAGDMDVAAVWQTLERVAAEIPDLPARLGQMQIMFETATHLSWTNFLASLGSEAGLALTLDQARTVSIPAGSGPLEVPEPGLLLLVKVQNDELFRLVTRFMTNNPQAAMSEESGLKLCSMTVETPLPMQLRPTVATSGDYFFAATSPDLIRSALKARSSGEGLVKTDEFKTLAPHAPTTGNQVAYTSKLFAQTMLRLQQQLQKQSLSAGNVSAAQTAIIEKWFQGKEPSYGYMVGANTETGWQFVNIGNRDFSGAMLMAPLAAGVAIPAAMILPALAKAKGRAQAINCMNNMKQQGLALRIWAVDHDDVFPFNVPAAQGGTLEACERGPDGFDLNAFRHFQVLSNELVTPKILVCPADSQRTPATNFEELQPANVSYQIRTGTNISDTTPEEMILYCPMHGHEGMADGSVRKGAGR